MEDQAEELRKLMTKSNKNLKEEKKDTQEIKTIEKEIITENHKIEVLADQIIDARKHRNTQAESLQKFVIEQKIKVLSQEEQKSLYLHKKLQDKIKELEKIDVADAKFIYELISSIKENN